MEELGAISGALALLANIVMAWNTHRLQLAVDQTPGAYPDEVVKGIAPIGYKHINPAGQLDLRPLATRAEPARSPCRRR
ncbi:MAG: Tn3 family transposase, partial [Candidatus Binataceae bacterium]